MGTVVSDTHQKLTMKLLSLLVVFIASVQSKYIQDPQSSLKALEYGYCSGSPQVFDLTADITPMPISLATGSIVTVLMSFDLKDTMPEGTMLGSCDYAMADIMAGLENGEAGCPTDKMPA